MSYRSPVGDILFSLKAVADVPGMIGRGLAGELDWDAVSSIVAEAGRFATEEIAPLNRPGDLAGARLRKRRRHHAAGLCGRLPALGGGGLERRLRAGRVRRHGPAACSSTSPAPKSGTAPRWLSPSARFSPRVPSARSRASARASCSTAISPRWSAAAWTGTMNLTEPQAGSDLNAVRTRAERAEDGSYRLFGQKIFITYGEHDMAENIVHLVLARLPGARAGTRGLTLFLAPKFLRQRRWLARRAQRPALRRDRAQARHPRLADLRHGLRRR